MLYHLHEFQHAIMTPARLTAGFMKTTMQSPLNPLSYHPLGRTLAAAAEVFERMTQRFGKPTFDLPHTMIGGQKVTITEEFIVEKPFCNLLHFKRHVKRDDPKVLIVAPMSGHYATLLRGTVEALLPHHDVYITDWIDTRMIPLKEGVFNLDDYINYVRQFLSLLGPRTHVIAVCQPAVPTLAAISLMASENDPNQPLGMILMGGPIDTRISKTKVTQTAEERPLSWFRKNVIATVPAYYPGAHRRVYPGFVQLNGFMSMNLDLHVGKHMNFFKHLVQGDGLSAESHRKFYNEYNAVMDLSEDFYLQTVDVVFQRHLLPRGQMKWRDPLTEKLHDVRPQDIKRTSLLSIEGELDDISARGQTTAAHDLCYTLSQTKQFHHFQLGCGHYGIFNGSKWRKEIMPRIRHFIRENDKNCSPIPAEDFKEIPDLVAEPYNRDKHGIASVRRWLKERDEKAGKVHVPVEVD